MIKFNKVTKIKNELKYIDQAVASGVLAGSGQFNEKCKAFLEKFLARNVFLVSSGTQALEMASILSNIKAGDEIIMPSYTFSSTANSFALCGAKIVFVDIRPDTMNIDENLIEQAITKKTKAIVPVHYAGVSCEMDKILEISKKHKLFVIEDAAQAILSKYKNKYLGTIGDIGCLSFHETKNITCGEGGATIINKKKYTERAEIIREKGTNRKKFLQGQVDKYSWVDLGSSFLLSEINAAFLFAQLENIQKITNNRLISWNYYYKLLSPLAKKGIINLPVIPKMCTHNGHIFYIKVKNLKERVKLTNYLKQKGIIAYFHYIPLHSSKAGKKYGNFFGKDVFTTAESERILRLPLYYGLHKKDIEKIACQIIKFYQ